MHIVGSAVTSLYLIEDPLGLRSTAVADSGLLDWGRHDWLQERCGSAAANGSCRISKHHTTRPCNGSTAPLASDESIISYCNHLRTMRKACSACQMSFQSGTGLQPIRAHLQRQADATLDLSVGPPWLPACGWPGSFPTGSHMLHCPSVRSIITCYGSGLKVEVLPASLAHFAVIKHEPASRQSHHSSATNVSRQSFSCSYQQFSNANKNIILNADAAYSFQPHAIASGGCLKW